MCRIDHTCFPPDIAFSKEFLAFHLNHPRSIARIAEKDARILGFVLGRADTHRGAHVLTLDVVPDARRQGIGAALMDALHGEILKWGIRKSFLEVGVGNVAAQQLYRKLRYRYLATLEGYYCGREDAFLMVRYAREGG